MPKVSKSEREEALARLREWIKPGDTVYTVLRHVSRSGMQREIGVVLLGAQCSNCGARVDSEGCPKGCQNLEGLRVEVRDLHPNHAVATVLGLRLGKRDGVIVGGCGMDMGFHLVYELSHALYGRGGYQCLGEGKCPSNYHVRCEGTRERFDLVHTDGYALKHRWL